MPTLVRFLRRSMRVSRRWVARSVFSVTDVTDRVKAGVSEAREGVAIGNEIVALIRLYKTCTPLEQARIRDGLAHISLYSTDEKAAYKARKTLQFLPHW